MSESAGTTIPLVPRSVRASWVWPLLTGAPSAPMILTSRPFAAARIGPSTPPLATSYSPDKALCLLWLLRERPHLTVSEASEALDVARSTAHRLLAMLIEHRFADQDPVTRTYHPGRALLEIGVGAVRNLDIRDVACLELERLAEDARETVQLVTLAGPRTLVIDAAECSEALRVSGRRGLAAAALHVGRQGAALRASVRGGPSAARSRATRATDRAFRHVAELERALERVREQGYATNFSENEDSIGAVAVAIRLPRGARPAAITLTAPIGRMTPERVPDVVDAAQRAATRIAARLDERP